MLRMDQGHVLRQKVLAEGQTILRKLKWILPASHRQGATARRAGDPPVEEVSLTPDKERRGRAALELPRFGGGFGACFQVIGLISPTVPCRD